MLGDSRLAQVEPIDQLADRTLRATPSRLRIRRRLGSARTSNTVTEPIYASSYMPVKAYTSGPIAAYEGNPCRSRRRGGDYRVAPALDGPAPSGLAARP